MYDDKRKNPKRKKNRLQGYDYSQNGAYYVTICTNELTELFWEGSVPVPDIDFCSFSAPLSEFGKTAETAINSISEHYPFVFVENYCIMPNHIHMIIYIENPGTASDRSLSAVIGQMKRWVSKQLGFAVWQKSFYDHIIRNEYDYEKLSEDIDQNPINWDSDRYNLGQEVSRH